MIRPMNSIFISTIFLLIRNTNTKNLCRVDTSLPSTTLKSKHEILSLLRIKHMTTFIYNAISLVLLFSTSLFKGMILFSHVSQGRILSYVRKLVFLNLYSYNYCRGCNVAKILAIQVALLLSVIKIGHILVFVQILRWPVRDLLEMFKLMATHYSVLYDNKSLFK